MPIHLVAFLFLAFLFMPNGLAAAENRSIRIGIFPLEPLNFTDKMGNAKGIYPDLIREVVKNDSWQLIFVPGSWKECLERLENGNIDLLTSIARSPERELKYDYNREAVIDNWSQVFTTPDAGIENFMDLAGKQIAIVERDINGKNFLRTAKNMGIAVEVKSYATNVAAFQAVQNHDAAAAVSSQHFGLRHADKFSLVATSIQFSPMSIYFAALKGQQAEILNLIDQRLSHWKQDKNSYYYRLLQHYLGPGVLEKHRLPHWVIYVTAGTIGLLLLSALWIISLNLLVKKRTAELQESEHAYRTVANYTYDWEFWILPDGSMKYVSPSCERITGYSTTDFMNHSDLLHKIIYPDDRSLWQNHINSPQSSCEVLEHRLIAKDETIKWIAHTCQSVFAPNGDYWGKRVSNRDITTMKVVQEQLRQSQKMEAVGTLAGGIAHDFNNILAAILGYTELTLNNPDCSPEIKNNLAQVLRAVRRAKDLIRQILTFSRKKERVQEHVNLHNVVTDAYQMLSKTIPSTVSLNLTSDPGTGIIIADTTQIHQIVINLCMNSYQALDNRAGSIDIALKAVIVDEQTAARYQNLRTGEYAQLSVSDTGTGMSPEVLTRIFEPFFTTKKQGEGTGMGLAIIHGIIQSHDGAVGVESEVGKGTITTVFLPLVQGGEVIERTRTTDRESNTKGTEHILWIDDEPMLAQLGKKSLEPMGYKVTATTSAIKGLSLFRSNPQGYDLIITDQTMPEMAGDTLAKRVQELRHDIPIIICTGHSAILTREKVQALGVKALLMKPIDRHELVQAIRTAFDTI